MATRIDPTTMRGFGSQITVDGKTFPVGPAEAPTKSASSATGLSGVTASGTSINITSTGTVVDGYDLRGRDINVRANNVTIRNCLLDSAVSWYCVEQIQGFSGLTVEYCHFEGGSFTQQVQAITGRDGYLKVFRNKFFRTPQDVIAVNKGLVEENYFAEIGWDRPAHTDLIYCGAQAGPIKIIRNYVDGTNGPGWDTNNAVRLVAEFGPIMHGVWAEGNVLMSGNYTIDAASRTSQAGNITFVNNLIKKGQYGHLYPAGDRMAKPFSYWHNRDFDTGAPLPNLGEQPNWSPSPVEPPPVQPPPVDPPPVQPPPVDPPPVQPPPVDPPPVQPPPVTTETTLSGEVTLVIGSDGQVKINGTLSKK